MATYSGVMSFSLLLGGAVMAVLLLLSLMLLMIVSDRLYDRREIARRPLRVMLRERRGRRSAPSAPMVSNVIAFRPAATKAKRQRRHIPAEVA
jgi:hypothetical protein